MRQLALFLALLASCLARADEPSTIGSRLSWVSPGPQAAASASSVSTPAVDVAVQWAKPPMRADVVTSAQIEVDVMPFLGRTDEGGDFNGYYSALSGLGAEYVRYSPWFGYPRVVVPELNRTKCQGSEWNSKAMDAIMSDFMTAVCGLKAADGHCDHSVSQQLSTMPGWMYVGGTNLSDVPEDPWQVSAVTYKAPLLASAGNRSTTAPWRGGHE